LDIYITLFTLYYQYCEESYAAIQFGYDIGSWTGHWPHHLVSM